MALAQFLLPEFDQEMANTRKTLERIPEDKLDWRPHPKSGTLGWLSTHLAEMTDWGAMTLTTDSFDVNPPGGRQYQHPKLTSRVQIVELFDQNSKKLRDAIAQATDQQLMASWSLLSGGKSLFSMPRIAVLRSMIFNHIIHHRAQLGVYLRLNDVPVPALYGPSADEQPMSAAAD